MSPRVVERLKVLRQNLDETPSSPWSNVTVWAGGANALILEFWPQHHSAFLEVTRSPRWLALPRFGRLGESSDTPANRAADQSEAAANKQIAEQAKQGILSFLDGILDVAMLRQSQSSQTDIMNQNSTEQNLLAVMKAIDERAKELGEHYSEDSEIAEKLGMPVEDVADYMDILEQRGLTHASNSASGNCARLSANGRMMLRDADFKPHPMSPSITVNAGGSVLVNVGSTLQNVTQTINHSAHLPHAQQLATLVEQLQHALEEVPPEHAEEAEAVAETARQLVEHANKEKPNASLVRVSAKGLQEAATTLATVSPPIIEIATKIVSALTGGSLS